MRRDIRGFEARVKAKTSNFFVEEIFGLCSRDYYIVECRRIFFISELVADEGVSGYSV